MQEFMTPPKHVNFRAKKLFGEMGRIVDGSIAYIDLNGAAMSVERETLHSDALPFHLTWRIRLRNENRSGKSIIATFATIQEGSRFSESRIKSYNMRNIVTYLVVPATIHNFAKSNDKTKCEKI